MTPEQAHLFLLAGVAGPEGPDRPENTVDEQVVVGRTPCSRPSRSGSGSGTRRWALDLLQSQSSLAHNPSLRRRLLVPADDRTRRILADVAA
jgi:hypothetical protein